MQDEFGKHAARFDEDGAAQSESEKGSGPKRPWDVKRPPKPAPAAPDTKSLTGRLVAFLTDRKGK